MSKRVEEYLAQVAQALRGQMPDERLEERISELRAHLQMSARDLRDEGREEDEAEIEAIRNLGPARSLSDDMMLQARGYVGRSAWSLSRLPMLMVPLTFLFSYAAMLKWGFSPDVQYSIMVLGAAPVLVTFLWRVFQTRRWLVMPVVATFAITYLAWTAVFDLGHRVFQSGTQVIAFRSGGEEYRNNLQAALRQSKERIAQADAAYRRVLGGGHAPSGANGVLVPNEMIVYRSAVVPGTIWWARSRQRVFQFASETRGVGQEEADQRWRDDGAQALRDMRAEVAAMQSALVGWRTGPPFTWDHAYLTYVLPLATIGIHGIFLMGLNGLIISLMKMRRVWERRRAPLSS